MSYACKLILFFVFLYCVLLELCLNLNLGLLFTENITNGKQCKERDAVMEMCVLDGTCMFSLQG